MAQETWDDYTVRKFQMLNETNRTLSPWMIVRSDIKKLARLNCIKHILSQIDYDNKTDSASLQIDSAIAITGIYEIRLMEDNLLKPGVLPG